MADYGDGGRIEHGRRRPTLTLYYTALDYGVRIVFNGLERLPAYMDNLLMAGIHTDCFVLNYGGGRIG